MDDINKGAKVRPAAEFVPAPEAVQGSGPAWEGQPLSRAVVGCQESAEDRSVPLLPSIENSHERLLAAAETARDPTRAGVLNRNSTELEGLNETGCEGKDTSGRLRCPSSNGSDVATLSPRGVSSSAENNSTGQVFDHSCFNGNRKAGRPGVTNTLSGSPKAGSTVGVDASITAQLVEGRAASVCGGLQHTDAVCDTEPNINPDRDTPEDKSVTDAAAEQRSGQGGDIDDFQELLQAAMRQSDAERAHDRKSARSLRRCQQSSPRQQGPVDQPSISTPEAKQLATTTPNNRTSDCGQDECRQGGTARVPNDITSESIESSLPSALTPAPELNAGERQWVRYLSPEGYAYLYDEVTGDSEWVMSGDEEGQSPQAQEPAGTTTRGAGHGELGSTGDVFDDQDGQTDLHGTASIKTAQERDPIACAAEGDSVGTCEVSQWSQDTSGPDAR